MTKSNVRSDLQEAITKGMLRAFSRGRARFACKECGQHIPVYPGKYPSACPTCSGELEELNQSECKPKSRVVKRKG